MQPETLHTRIFGFTIFYALTVVQVTPEARGTTAEECTRQGMRSHLKLDSLEVC